METTDQKQEEVVVASLSNDEIPISYSCVSKSPDNRLVVLCGEDTIRIVSIKPSGLKEVRTVCISQFLRAQNSIDKSLNDVFQQGNNMNPNLNMNRRVNTGLIHISDVSWSICQYDMPDDNDTSSTDINSDDNFISKEKTDDSFLNILSMPDDLKMADDSLIAVGGSNGVVLIWRACDLLRGLSDMTKTKEGIYQQFYGQNRFHKQDSNSAAVGYPEAVLVEHSKAVKVAFHPRKPNLLLTASLDGTAKLWERIENVDPEVDRKNQEKKRTWFGLLSTKQFDNAQERNFHWRCKQVFKPNCGGIREIKWSCFSDDLFAMVAEGWLIVYFTIVPHRPACRIAAHAREATTLDWHPSKPFVIATGGVDKKVKVWNLEDELSVKSMGVESFNFSNSSNPHKSTDSHGSGSNHSMASTPSPSTSPPPRMKDSLDHSYHDKLPVSDQSSNILNRSMHTITLQNTDNWGNGSSHSEGLLRKMNSPMPKASKSTSKLAYELSIAERVEKLRWRPPKCPVSSNDRKRHLNSNSVNSDHHGAMLAVSTSVIGSASAGSGKVYLFSCDRAFMPLSIVDGHKEKCCPDFIWLDTPDGEDIDMKAWDGKHFSTRRNMNAYYRNYDEVNRLENTWQHILTCGRDGKCLVQNLCRGEKPISTVPPSAFALAELSPFQQGYGSLQLITAHQNVPAGNINEYELCGFRRDEFSAKAPGIFNEKDAQIVDNSYIHDPDRNTLNELSQNLELTFSTTDSGDIRDIGVKKQNNVTIAPEVVHLSRFADAYKLGVDHQCPTKASVCRYNASIARNLKFNALAHMWNTLASLLVGAGSDDLSHANPKNGFPLNALSFALLPTLRRLLMERADAGDVQTCVVICEVMEVFSSSKHSSSMAPQTLTLAIPNLDIRLVRQWYISYIELLQQMCLFSHATNLIRICKDPEIAKLNQQSTTFHESCPSCYKPLQSGQNSCKSCRQQIGICFLCHESVKGVLVWCPGCGHSGHLGCALDWFGKSQTDKLRKLCPTGCGHQCNLILSSSHG